MSLLDRINSRGKRTGETGRKAERKTAKRLDGDLVPASGGANEKGDYRLPGVLAENKSTQKGQFTLEYGHLRKIAQEARATGRAPSLSFQFTLPSGDPRPSGAWVCIPEYLWKEILDAQG